MKTVAKQDPRVRLPEINSWRRYYMGARQQDIREMVLRWEAEGFQFGTVTIDEGWYGKHGDWEPAPHLFPDLKELVDWIHQKGYRVRIWTSFLHIQPGTKAYEKHFPHDCLIGEDGKPSFNINLRAYRLDPRKESVRFHIREKIRRLLIDFDVDGFKTDFPVIYHPEGWFYKSHGPYQISEEDRRTMTPEFYKWMNQCIQEFKPDARIENVYAIPNCEDHIQDLICGDLIAEGRSASALIKVCRDLRKYIGDRPIVPWIEMIWGGHEGWSEVADDFWYQTFLEYMAISVNYQMKLEHSFYPFEYPNISQIRALSNLYGAMNPCMKVLYAGKHLFSLAELQKDGLELNHKTEFLVLPTDNVTVLLQTALLKTDATSWRCREVYSRENVTLRAQNEFWGMTNNWEGCGVSFEAKAGKTYLLWHEGPADPYFHDLYRDHRSRDLPIHFQPGDLI